MSLNPFNVHADRELVRQVGLTELKFMVYPGNQLSGKIAKLWSLLR